MDAEISHAYAAACADILSTWLNDFRLALWASRRFWLFEHLMRTASRHIGLTTCCFAMMVITIVDLLIVVTLTPYRDLVSWTRRLHVTWVVLLHVSQIRRLVLRVLSERRPVLLVEVLLSVDVTLLLRQLLTWRRVESIVILGFLQRLALV